MKTRLISSDRTCLLEEFIESKRVDRGLSKLTLEAYCNDLTQFFEWLPRSVTIRDVRPQDIEEYLKSLALKKTLATSISRKLSTLRQFFQFCCLENHFESNPTEFFTPPKTPRLLPKALNLKQVSRLLEAADQGLPYPEHERESLQARDRALVFLLYATGIRVSEAVQLTLHQIDLQGNYLRVRGKGGKERIAPFVPSAGERLQTYLNAHRQNLIGKRDKETSVENDFVFLNSRGQPITRQRCWQILKSLAAQSGLPQELHPHQLRHSFATHLLQSGMNLRTLQLLLGHADITTTQIYTHLSREDLKRAHQKYHPRG